MSRLNVPCPNCARKINERDNTVNCDNCNAFVHVACTDLSNEEVKRITRHSTKNLKFFCTKCADNFNQMSDLKTMLVTLSERLGKLESKLDYDANLPPKVMEELLSEMRNRINREKNIIIFGLPESGNGSDVTAVNEILHEASNNNNIMACSIRRLGHDSNVNGKFRPVKVVLESSKIARILLKHKYRLKDSAKFKNCVIRDDKTPQQTKYLRLVREELDEKIKNGHDNLTIKYIQGVPTIIPNDSSKNR